MKTLIIGRVSCSEPRLTAYHRDELLVEVYRKIRYSHVEFMVNTPNLHTAIENQRPDQVFILDERPTMQLYVAQHLNARWVRPYPAAPKVDIITQGTIRKTYNIEFEQQYQFFRLLFSGLSEKWSKVVLKDYGSIANFLKESHSLSPRKLIRKHLEEHSELWVQN